MNTTSQGSIDGLSAARQHSTSAAEPPATRQAPDKGELTTNESPARDLVRLASIVDEFVDSGRPWREAAAEVLGRIKGARWCDAWLLRQGWRAAPVPDDLVFCPGYASGHDRLRDHEDSWNSGDPSARWHMAPMRLDEARFRGLACLPGAGSKGVVLYADEWAELQPIPPLQGRAGVPEFLHYAWTAQARTRGDVCSGVAGQVAMLRTDAVGLFPELFAAQATEVHALRSEASPHAATLLQLVPGARLDEPAQAWTDEGMFKRLAELKGVGLKAPMPALLAELEKAGIKLSARQVQRRVKPFAAAEAAAQGPFGQLVASAGTSTKTTRKRR